MKRIFDKNYRFLPIFSRRNQYLRRNQVCSRDFSWFRTFVIHLDNTKANFGLYGPTLALLDPFFCVFGPFLILFDRIGPLIVPDSPKEKTIFQTVSRGQISSDGTKSHTRIDENWAKIDTLYRKSIWLHIIGIDAHFCYGLNVINKFYCCTLWLRYN